MHRAPQLDITPLVGVLFVLLAVPFVAHHTMDVEVPRDDECECVPQPYVQPSIWTLHADGSATLDDHRGVRRLAPVEVVTPATPVVFVDAESAVPWGDVVGFVARIREGGTRVALRISESDP